MKIILVDPRGYQRGLNTGLAYISSNLKSKGHDVHVIDFNNKIRNETERIKKIQKADIIGFSIKSSTIKETNRLINLLPEISSKTICGGPHITCDGTNFITKTPFFNIGVIAEGEETICEITEGKDLPDIKGIIYRQDKEIVKTVDREPIKNLDSLPFPDYSCFDSIGGKIITYPLITSRGCPYNCIFCCVNRLVGKTWRFRSPKNVIDELIYAKRLYKIEGFQILDDNFTLNIKRSKEICQRLVDEKISLKWSCPNGIRADKLDLELLKLMKDSGCVGISIGIETCIPEIFQKLNKGESLECILESINMARKVGLKVQGFFMIGLPGSTLALDKKTIKMAEDLKLDESMFGLLVPYPGTPMWNLLQTDSQFRVLTNWTEGFHFGTKPKIVFDTKTYNDKERLKAFYYAHLRFHDYSIFTDEGASTLDNGINLLRMILANDPYRILNHLCILAKKYYIHVLYNKLECGEM